MGQRLHAFPEGADRTAREMTPPLVAGLVWQRQETRLASFPIPRNLMLASHDRFLVSAEGMTGIRRATDAARARERHAGGDAGRRLRGQMMDIRSERRITIDRRTLLRGLAGAALAAVPLTATSRLTLASPTPLPTLADSPPVGAVAPLHQGADMTATNGSAQPVIPSLLAQGYPVVAIANPLRGVKYDADYLAASLKMIDGPILLVGHSYGGVVISNVANPNVVGLVFVAGYAPDAGESATSLSEQFPGSTLGATLAPPVALPDGTSDLYIQPDKFWLQFAADVPEAEAKLMAATQRPFTTAAVSETSGPAAWKTIPSRFIYGDLDKNIPATLLAFMAERAGSRETAIIKGASHVVMISHPEAVATVIVNAAVAANMGVRSPA
jgi:pimeloyl-ACP methyl ester carboxylesterase